jgi:GWxTD domain-containing protein
MAITGYGRVTAWLLLAVLIDLGINAAAPHANAVEAQRTSMPRIYQQWLDQDVRWIITPDERTAFLALSKNEERDRFVEQFWLRRNPIPGSARNKFKEEHYRRIAYANVHFPWQTIPGWETDRGRIYIVLGPPDTIKVQSANGSGDSAMPAELWHYRLATGDKDFRFSDLCRCGDLRLEAPQRMP